MFDQFLALELELDNEYLEEMLSAQSTEKFIEERMVQEYEEREKKIGKFFNWTHKLV